jgi:DNA-binding NtrC family response regulator
MYKAILLQYYMTNSFWREALDHIPGLFLIFRVDEKENAQLIFANSHIRNVLGYKPEEFVLASESDGTKVHAEVSALVDLIAEKSRNGNGGEAPVCRFHSKRAEVHYFNVIFRIFTVKSSPNPFIAVSMEPATAEAGADDTDSSVLGQRNTGFVAGSPLMQALIRKVDALADQPVHLLFRGERATGKRTLARQVLQGEELRGVRVMEWNLEAMPVSVQNRAVDRLCVKGPDPGPAPGDSGLALLVVEISLLTSANQAKLLDWLRERQDNGKVTRVLATTSFLLEERMQQGEFSADLYYFLSLETLLLPPLSQRRDDLRVLTEQWVRSAAAVLDLGELQVSGEVMDQVLGHGWSGNFHEFHAVMRRSLLASPSGSFRLLLSESGMGSAAHVSGHTGRDAGTVDAPAGLVAGTRPAGGHGDELLSGDVLPFDEMNRRYLKRVLEKTGNKIYGDDGAARLLGMKPTTLQSKLKKLGVR